MSIRTALLAVTATSLAAGTAAWLGWSHTLDSQRLPRLAIGPPHAQRAVVTIDDPPGAARNGALAEAREDVYNALMADAAEACAGGDVVVSRLEISVKRRGEALSVRGFLPHRCAPRAVACADGVCRMRDAG